MYEKEMQKIESFMRRAPISLNFTAAGLEAQTCFLITKALPGFPSCTKRISGIRRLSRRTTTPAGEVYGIFSSSGTTGDKTYYVYSKKDKEIHEEFVRPFIQSLASGRRIWEASSPRLIPA